MARPSRAGVGSRHRAVMDRRFIAAAGTATVAAGVLGAFRIGEQSLWFDELISMQLARESWTEMWAVTSSHELEFAAYHVPSWIVVHVFGDSEAAIRSLSVVFGALAVVLLMVLARRLFGTRAALLVAPVFLIHAQ